MQKFVFIIKELTCAGCADSIERELRSSELFSGVVLSLLERELTIYTKNKLSVEEVRAFVQKVADKIEPGLEVVTEYHQEGDYQLRKKMISALKSKDTLLTISGIIPALIALLIFNDRIQFLLYLISYLIIGRQVIITAFRKLFSKYIFNEHFLMTVATIGAFALGEHTEAIAVMLFYQIGRFFESKVVEYSQHSINEMLKLKPDYANLIKDNQIVKVAPDLVKIGDLLQIKPGERIPLDVEIVSGNSFVDNSLITGESEPIAVALHSSIQAGAINLQSNITVKAVNDFAHSNISRIIDLVKLSKSNKTITEKFITRFARVYTPMVLIMAVLIATLPLLIFPDATFKEWLYRSLIFLVISCPCALVISVPLSFFSGLAVLIRKGILIKGGIHIETLAKVNTVIFDKTGTLTIGKPFIKNMIPAPEFSEADLLKHAYQAEAGSNHPLARVINAEYHRVSGIHQETDFSLSTTEFSGKGVKSASSNIIAGSIAFLLSENIAIPAEFIEKSEHKTVVAVSYQEQFAGIIVFSDSVRKNVAAMIADLKKQFVKKIVMLSGDSETVVKYIAEEIGVKDYYSGLSPQDKVNQVEIIKRNSNGKTAFVGDGINDAPAMALADIGIAMGGIGSAAAIETADMVLQTDEIDKLGEIINISRKTLNNAKQNIIFALGIKGVFLLLGALGLITVWGAVFADVGVTVLAVLNSLRLLKEK